MFSCFRGAEKKKLCFRHVEYEFPGAQADGNINKPSGTQ